MTLPVIWKDRATLDLTAIVTRIAKDSPEAATRLGTTIFDKTAILGDFPEMGRKRASGGRELVVHEHYIVIFRSHGGAVEILRVRSTYRRPL